MRNLAIAFILCASIAPAIEPVADAGTWASVNFAGLPPTDAANRSKDELATAMLALYWGDFVGSRDAKRVHRREDTVQAFSQYVGWIPYRALVYEREAVRLGLEEVDQRLRNPANYRCVGLERGGGFLVDVINQMPATATHATKFQCASVAKAPDPRPSGVAMVASPNGDGTSTQRPQDKSKIADQAGLKAAATVNDNNDVVIVDSFVSGDSMMYTLETVSALLDANPNGQQRFIVLAIRDGARSYRGEYAGRVSGYASPNMPLEDPGGELYGDDMTAWTKIGETKAHLAGDRLARNLVERWGDRFQLVIATAWYLVAEDVAAELSKAPLPNATTRPMYVYGFLSNTGQGEVPAFDPNVNLNATVTVDPEHVFPEAPNPYPGFFVWSWTPAMNENLRDQLSWLVANAVTGTLRATLPTHP